ncbi:hypothetical protein BJX63DRAFT_64489 [Aspergillus granulosus]|uniref:DUF221-domain-containing protein n=1 Tax=Aspergillus granulosus TaxID=176169 RepID=A0ABR4GWR6_9EURO
MANDLTSALEHAGGNGQKTEGISIKTFVASLATAIIIFTVEFLLFLLLKGKLTRIYQPRTYLVPDRERTEPSPPGLFRWVVPIFRTSSSAFIQKCGLDAYFFLRYLRMLLKIFVPLAFIILPTLLPLNKVGGKDRSYKNGTDTGDKWNVTGLDQLAWGNVAPENTQRYWGHLILAVFVVIYVCAIFFDELRSYIRLRQAYLTSPQHRLRASATTVLVTAIPKRWLSLKALEGLYDVFPGGIRNIWINRNFDELNEKVKERDRLALKLETAITELIIKCKKVQMKQAKAAAKKAGIKDADNKEREAEDLKASKLAMSAGISSGDPHQAHTLQEILHGDNLTRKESKADKRRYINPLESAIGLGGTVGQGVGKLGRAVFGTVKKHDPAEQNSDQPLSGDAITEDTATAYGAAEPTNMPTGTEGESQPRRPFWRSRPSNQSKSSNRTEPDELPLTALETPVVDTGERSSSEDDSPVRARTDNSFNLAQNDGVETEDGTYPVAYNENFEKDDTGAPLWQKYIRPKDRDTMRLPIFGISWMPSLWLVGKKVDTIDYCRKEVARLNLEIEIDQQHPERFPLMTSAFIQFNHQVAAHMACQAVSHHVPKQMAPRTVEISPDDVIWDNMSIKWWERYLRTFGIVAIVIGMVIGWAFPVAFTGLLSQLSYLEDAFTWLSWISKLPEWFISAVQGILPPLFLAILMAILPLLLRFLCRTQGLHTGMEVELTVQNYYFAFLFVQLFLIVAISSSITTIIQNITDVTSWPDLLAQNIPLSSNYFFSYMILQALSVSAGALVQIFSLVSWFILAPILDSTARRKWARTTNLNQVKWGTFFPVYTTLASIGLIYSVIAPLILVFNIITFSLFWFVYRYNMLYVTQFRFDTGGLLFPRAINQLFTGIYVMELCLIGLFFLVRDVQGTVACKGQAITMIVVLALTVGFQFLLNEAFGPLIRYLPITLEDEAVRRDEEFARAQRARLGMDDDGEEEEEEAEEKLDTLEHRLRDRERAEFQDYRDSSDIELKKFEATSVSRRASGLRRKGQGLDPHTAAHLNSSRGPSWAAPQSPNNRRSKYFGTNSGETVPTIQRMQEKLHQDAEAQGPARTHKGTALFAGIHDELEDLTPDERDQLVQRAFQHEALRAKRPVIWIPRDDLGVSDEEVYRTQRFSKYIWISNEYQALDGKGRPIFSRSPPDFSEVDLIQL